MYKFNSILLSLYVYIPSLSLIFSPLISSFYVKLFLLITLNITLIIINKFVFTKKVIIYLITIIIFGTLNLLLVPYKSYVFSDVINLLIYSFMPVYLFSQNIVKIIYIKEYLIKLSIVFTYLLPIYYFYRQTGYINYFDIGFISHLNILFLVYYLLTQKKRKVIITIYILLNILILAILGSRMVLIATILTTLSTFLLTSNKKNIKFYINTLGISSILIFIFANIFSILIYLNNIVQKIGLNSRNLTLFIAQLEEGFSNETLLSGRDNIYPLVLEYLKENGMFPSGFGVARNLTLGTFYHSHNFLLELMLILGFVGFTLIIGWFCYKMWMLFKFRNIKNNHIVLDLLLLFLISFLVRSITGTYFLTDTIFLVSLGIIISLNEKKLKVLE